MSYAPVSASSNPIQAQIRKICSIPATPLLLMWKAQ